MVARKRERTPGRRSSCGVAMSSARRLAVGAMPKVRSASAS